MLNCHYSFVNLMTFTLFMKYYMRFQSTEDRCQMSRFSSLSIGAAVTAFPLSSCLSLQNFDFEDEHEKNQIKSYAYAPASAG